MREQINENALENVVGGTVVVSGDKMKVGFTTLNEKYSLKNCTFDQVMSVIYGMYGSYQDHTGTDFDTAVKQALQSRGWI